MIPVRETTGKQDNSFQLLFACGACANVQPIRLTHVFLKRAIARAAADGRWSRLALADSRPRESFRDCWMHADVASRLPGLRTFVPCVANASASRVVTRTE